MDTVFWSIVGIVAALALIACLLTIILVVRSSAAVATAPAGGATTPPATTIRTQIRTFVDTHWDKIGGTAAALFAVFLIIWMFGWMLPNVSAAYYKHDGWGFWLLVLVATFILPALIWPGRVRKILLWTLGVFLAGVILPALLPAIWEVGFGGSSSSPVQTARTVQTVRQASPDPCDGNYRPLVIGPSAVLATPGGRNCMIDFDVREGGVILIGPNGEEFDRPVTKDQPAGRSSFRVIEWKSAGSSARLNVRYYR